MDWKEDLRRANQLVARVRGDSTTIEVEEGDDSVTIFYIGNSDYSIFYDETEPENPEGNFIVEKAVIYPGVRTLPNGDPGYPDDEDIVSIGRRKTLWEAVIYALELEAYDNIHGIAEDICMVEAIMPPEAEEDEYNKKED